MNEVKLAQDLGFLRIGAAVPELRVANVSFNVAGIIKLLQKAQRGNVQVATFPEMAITGYTINDLLQQEALIQQSQNGLGEILNASAGKKMLVTVGMPLPFDEKIFNCAVVLNSGRILGVIPKSFLPSYREFYEERWFSPAGDARGDTIDLAGQKVPFGTNILFRLNGARHALVGVEVCEDLWVPLAPHEYQAAAGATVLLNISASNEILGKADWRRTMVMSESGRCIAAYCYVSSGFGESSNDVVYSGHVIMAENGVVLRESERFGKAPQLVISDFDLERLAHDRRATTSFHELLETPHKFRVIDTEVSDPPTKRLNREIAPHPFVPADPARRAESCREIFSMQVSGLAQKLSGAKIDRAIIGISGGLDSTLALLVAAKTMDFLGLPHRNIHAFTLPGFGTTRRTLANATRLCKALEVSFEHVDITASCSSHLKDLKHSGQHDLVFENVQARYRTEFLFNKANELNAILVGTGDLTEVALGWATFSGDHMSHYHVNISVPKTLARYLVAWVADDEPQGAQKVLYDILETPISPELLPAKNGRIAQKSEAIVGPVELTDFFLYPFVRFGMRPGKILFLADEVNKQQLFSRQYTLAELHQWLKSFLRRFFANQFKRTCFPEGPKVGSVSLSPRGDWRMPSDADVTLWMADLDAMYARLRQ